MVVVQELRNRRLPAADKIDALRAAAGCCEGRSSAAIDGTGYSCKRPKKSAITGENRSLSTRNES